MDEFSADEDISDSKISEIAAKMKSIGFTKRAVRHAPSVAGSAPESVAVEQEEVSEDDIREAVRQLRKKALK